MTYESILVRIILQVVETRTCYSISYNRIRLSISKLEGKLVIDQWILTHLT